MRSTWEDPSAKRCARHDLACGPDGRCVLCRRQARQDLAPTTPPRRSLVLLALGVVVCAVAGLSVRAMGTPSEPAEEASGRVILIGRPGRMPQPLAPSPSAVPADNAGPVDTAVRAETAGAPAASSQVDLENAKRQVRVVMYSTSWCPVCKKARAWLAANQIAYEDRDIERNRAWHDECVARAHAARIPTFDVDGEVMVSFGEASFEALLERAAERRLAR
jgi:glutaredoxin